MIQKQKSLLSDIESLVPGLEPNTDILNTQAQVLTSWKLVEDAATAMNLYTDPEFADVTDYNPIHFVGGYIRSYRRGLTLPPNRISRRQLPA